MDKLLKEKDKLEMQAMVLRMQERDKAVKSNVLEGETKHKDLSEEQLDALIPELRKKARDKYLKDREETQMNLYKKILDDQQKVFQSQSETK